MPFIALIFAGLALLVTPAQAQAQGFECARLQPAAGLTPAYGPVGGPADGQTRCEGFFARNVSQPFIELVSLTRGSALAGDSAAAAVFELQADARMPLRLLVQPLRSGPFYRVDAPLAPGQSLRWDAATMLAATGLRAADLGFLALVPPRQTSASALTAVAPLALSTQARQARQALAVVRVSVPVSSIAWRAYRAGADAGPQAAWVDLPNSQRYAWQRTGITIDLPPDGKGLRVDVQAVAAEDGRVLPLLRFALVGPADVTAD